MGKVTSVTDSLSGVTSYEYDDLQRLTKATQPDPDGVGLGWPDEKVGVWGS